MSSSERFGFVQLELPWALGPVAGRYMIRGHAGEPEYVLVLATLGAQQRRFLRDRRKRSVPAEPGPTPVQTTRATLVDTAGRERSAAELWLSSVDAEAEVERAITVLNGVLHAQRTAASDPYVREISIEGAIVARVGIGAGEEVAHGRWTTAVELPPRRARSGRRPEALHPQERLAAILGGRDVALACEELALRARMDFDHERYREAALQLRVALEAALAELRPWSGRPAIATRLDALREERGAVGAAANMALEGGLDTATIADLERVLDALEGALRARVACGPE